ncbi:hypothetical protein D3C75_383240 [compost metagenome]
MKNRRYLLLITGVVLIILLSGFGLFTYFNEFVTFDEAIGKSLDSKSVSSVEIIRRNPTGEKIVNLTDPAQIQQVLEVFSDLKLKKSSLSEVRFDDSYWITLKGNNQRRTVGITLYDDLYLDLYNYGSSSPKNVHTSYLIASDVDLNELDKLLTKPTKKSGLVIK